MDSLWPWLMVAGLGALHGLNPATGWVFAAAWGLHSCGSARRGALWALLPIALGHLVSIALVVAALTLGLTMDRSAWQAVAVALLVTLLVAVVIFMLIAHLAGHRAKRFSAPVGFAGLALWSFTMATAHGAGLMLVPALATLCLGEAAASRNPVPGPWVQAFAAVAVHTVVMLAVSGLAAVVACRGWGAGRQWLQRFRRQAVR
jgi:hypothetical protein